MHPHARHVAPRLVFASEPIPTSRSPHRVPELEVADQSISPCATRRRFPPHELAPTPKPRSRRCFVCGTTGRHPLDFRVCPRTAVLLRRSLARINDDGRLVSFDGSPLPMTRHPGGVAAHLISRFCNPTRTVLEPSESLPAPPAAHVPSRVQPHDIVPSPSREFNSRSPHAIPPVDRAEPPEHVPFAHIPQPSSLCDRARATILLVLLESMLNSVFRLQLRAILILLDRLSTENPSTLRERIQPVFFFESQSILSFLQSYLEVEIIVPPLWKGGIDCWSTSPFPPSLCLAYGTSVIGPSICFVRTHAIIYSPYT
ncbi:hypothetical protein C8R45DRAFT_381264 [Mycena sanguinolenta]|nr:hypothetical protein C8R45DRAFT_381264 [Mycena sanguinolenta]